LAFMMVFRAVFMHHSGGRARLQGPHILTGSIAKTPLKKQRRQFA
jgi:hypothetical protein